jgi:diguanylate cyclase (GGDEF)-like protein
MSTLTRLVGSSGTVLVVDDDSSGRLLVRSTLEQSGLMVIEAADGVEAVDAFRSESPDVIVMDVEMPRRNGYDACEAIRALPDGSRVPIMMLTGHGDLGSVNRAYEAGATDFLSKPIPWALLGHRVAYLLRASRVRRELERSEERQSAVLAAVPDLLLELNAAREIVQVFGSGERKAMLGSDAVLGRSIVALLPPDALHQFSKTMAAAARGESVPEFEFEIAAGMQGCFVEARVVPYREHGLLVMMRDVTERRRSIERIRELAYFDTLTGLPNVAHFHERLGGGVSHSRATGCSLALVHLDLDHFSRINDSFGHAVGDGVLRAIAVKLRGLVESTPTDVFAARFGGDEFSLLQPQIENEAEAEALAQRVAACFSEPVQVEDHEILVTATVGLAICPGHGSDVQTLMRNVHAAVAEGKSAGRNRVQPYTAALARSSRERLELAAELRRAIENGELQLAFQPQVDLRHRRLAGFESLLRWQHPVRGWVPPSLFVPIAEESSLIVPLSEWVLDAALTQMREWRARRYDVLRVAVNLSSAHFSRCDVAKWVSARLNRFGVAPSMLELEITEGILMRDADQTTASLAELKSLGVRVAVDDFGTGYSSLAYLKRFALDALKIDRSFVTDIATNSGDAAICGAIIAMAHRLGLEVIAEGIETSAQLAFLREQGCDTAQGYLLGKPMFADRIEVLLKQLGARAAAGETGDANTELTGTA